MTPDVLDLIPVWIRVTCLSEAGSQQLAKNFYEIERSEQAHLRHSIRSGVISRSVGSSDKLSPYDIRASIEQGERNRYTNIFPYEHSRVPLKSNPSTYINANYVQFNENCPKYVITQAPLPVAFVDFWQMVWDCKIRIIYMLTPLIEGLTTKAHDYWQESQYDQCRISKHSKVEHNLVNLVPVESWNEHRSVAIVTELTIENEDAPLEAIRQITHVHAVDWRDMMTFDNPFLLTRLINQPQLKQLRKDYAASESTNTPILVHCSAGCGRSGAFAAVDTALHLLHSCAADRQSKDVMYEIIKAFRLQRTSLVQTMRQYTLCDEAVFAEWIYQLRLDPGYLGKLER